MSTPSSKSGIVPENYGPRYLPQLQLSMFRAARWMTTHYRVKAVYEIFKHVINPGPKYSEESLVKDDEITTAFFEIMLYYVQECLSQGILAESDWRWEKFAHRYDFFEEQKLDDARPCQFLNRGFMRMGENDPDFLKLRSWRSFQQLCLEIATAVNFTTRTQAFDLRLELALIFEYSLLPMLYVAGHVVPGLEIYGSSSGFSILI